MMRLAIGLIAALLLVGCTTQPTQSSPVPVPVTAAPTTTPTDSPSPSGPGVPPAPESSTPPPSYPSLKIELSTLDGNDYATIYPGETATFPAQTLGILLRGHVAIADGELTIQTNSPAWALGPKQGHGRDNTTYYFTLVPGRSVPPITTVALTGLRDKSLPSPLTFRIQLADTASTTARHLPARLHDTDLEIAGIRPGMTFNEIKTKIPEIEVAKDQTNPSIETWSLDHAKVGPGFITATQGKAVMIVLHTQENQAHGVGQTARGLQLGDAADKVVALYGQPQVQQDWKWYYYSPGEEIAMVVQLSPCGQAKCVVSIAVG